MALAVITSFNLLHSQSPSPSDEVWGLYASGVREPLKAGMDPCWITYTVAQTDNPRIIANIENGLMGIVRSGVSWYEASAAKRLYSQYFEDQPDGMYKLSPCKVVLPDLNGRWMSNGRGYISLRQSGTNISGTAGGMNNGDHWGKGHREGGSIVGYIQDDGTVVLQVSWGDGTYTEDFLHLSKDQRTLSGTWNWYTNSSKATKKSSGTYFISRN